MKTILALNQGQYLGGAELFFSDLLPKLGSDFNFHLITGNNPDYQKRYAHSAVKIHEIQLPSLKPMSLRSYKKYKQAQKQIAMAIDEIKPDKIISNTVRTHLLVSRLAKRKGIPLVWMAHDVTFPKLLLRCFKSCPQTVVSCSEFVQDFYRKTLGERPDLNYKIIYPFALERNQLSISNESKKEKVIGMVGKLIPWKGHDLFIKMAQKIHAIHPEYRFKIIGGVYQNNPESHAFHRHCQQLIEALHLEGIVTIETFVENIFDALNRWEVLVHCSREPEPLGRVILEGMASGCAVVASKLGGSKEVVRHHQTGLVVKPSVDEFSKAVNWYLSHPQERAEMAERARKEVCQTYTWTKVLEEFKMILD